MSVVNYNLLYNYYPFYLDNKFGLGDVHYLYQLVSPTYNKKTCKPYFSLVKVSEKNTYYTQSLPLGKDSDLLTVCKNGMDSIRKGEQLDKDFDKVKFICDNFLKDKDLNIISNNNNEFPNIELAEDLNNELQKTLIVGIRSYLRWKNYKLFVSRKVDILITNDEFIVADIKSDDESIWLEPTSLYKNNDIMMTTSLENISKLNKKLAEWKKEEFKPSELSKLINKFEFESFDRPSLSN